MALWHSSDRVAHVDIVILRPAGFLVSTEMGDRSRL